jgi:restriction system protein
MTFREAAEEVLRRHSPGAPLHYRRISELALADGLVVSKGTTPEATMGAQLYTT